MLRGGIINENHNHDADQLQGAFVLPKYVYISLLSAPRPLSVPNPAGSKRAHIIPSLPLEREGKEIIMLHMCPPASPVSAPRACC
jgi:hypothetical protein